MHATTCHCPTCHTGGNQEFEALAFEMAFPDASGFEFEDETPLGSGDVGNAFGQTESDSDSEAGDEEESAFETFETSAPPRMHRRCASLMVTVPGTYPALETLIKKWIASCVTSRTRTGGKPARREQALVTNNPSLVNLWKKFFKDMSGQKVKITAKYQWGSNRVESIDFSIPVHSIDMPGLDIVVAPPMSQFIRKALSLLDKQAQVGYRLGPAQTPRLRCLLNGLLSPGFDDQYVGFRELWSYRSYVSKNTPRWDLILLTARDTLDFARRHYSAEDKAVLGALRVMDADIWKGIQWLDQQHMNLGSAMSAGMVVVKDWIAARQKRQKNLYACYR